MIFLEIAMIVIGLGAVVVSLRVSTNVEKEETKEMEVDTQREMVHMRSVLDSFTSKAETVCDNLEDKMEQLSNEKIMGISEYSDQVLDKIQKNHEEVVFLYDMMNGKQEELKSLVHEIDTQKAEFQNEAAIEYQKMKEQEKILDEMKKSLEVDFLQFQSEQRDFRKEFEKLREDYAALAGEITNSLAHMQNDFDSDFDKDFEAEIISGNADSVDDELDDDFSKLLEETSSNDLSVDEPVPPFEDSVDEESTEEFSFDSSVFDAEIARIEEEETKAQEAVADTDETYKMLSSGYQPVSEQTEAGNHNDEIISLYKKGRSVLEISKMLSLGQGEVKFVIDLYNAR